jgi:flavin reductase (DIM6/NTAB) family NADH-FMN oxidoreductase RutF
MQSHQAMISSEYPEPAFVYQALRLSTFSSTPKLLKSSATGPPRRAYGGAHFQRKFTRASLKSADDGGSARKVISDRNANVSPAATPWQLAPAPVYAICTTSSEIGRPNMNILTYITPCGLGPSPRFAVALLEGTLTWVSVKQTGSARLMLLAEGHAELVPVLGQLSGRDVDKIAEVRALGYEVQESQDGVPFLPGSLGYMDVVVDEWIDCGDHELAVCSTVGYRLLAHDKKPLTTGFLRNANILFQ